MKDVTEVKIETMTSREIAALTGILHRDVLRDIDIIIPNLGQSSKSITYK